jgi:hypothetical protein
MLTLLLDRKRYVLAALASILLSGYLGQIASARGDCDKFQGICQQAGGTRSSTECSFPEICQWEDCSRYIFDLSTYPELYDCSVLGQKGGPYTDTCVAFRCGLSWCPCVGVSPCGP